MALHLDHRLSGPPDRHAYQRALSPSTASALHLLSRQHHAPAGPTLQPVSVSSAASTLGLLDADDMPGRSMPSCCPHHDRRRPSPYLASAHGCVYYSPTRVADRSRCADSGSFFPAPLIEPRPRRPHSIHIVSYPPGFVPQDLRSGSSRHHKKKKHLTRREKREKRKARKEQEKERKREETARSKAERERAGKQEKRLSLRSLASLPPGGDRVGRVIDKIFAAFSSAPKPSPVVSAPSTPTSESRPSSFGGFARRLSRIGTAVPQPILVAEPAADTPAAQPHSMTGAAIPRAATTGAIPTANRSVLMPMRSVKTMGTPSVTEVQKPVASGSGLTCSILLAEPNVFLSGFDHDHQTRRGGPATSALLRGKLQLNVSKNVKIKSVTLRLVGKARTEWPEGIPPLKTDLYEEQTLRKQSLVFFHAMHQGMWDTEYGSQCTYTLKDDGAPKGPLQTDSSSSSIHLLGKGRSSTLTAKELKRLSLQSVNSRSFGKGDSPHINHVQAKGYKVFRPGTYEYSFELPIDHNQPETAKLQYGSVRWDLEATVERAGAFKPNLHGSREVSMVRLPDQLSLETIEPISISRHWEDQLHYDIVISGKSFPIGGRIPIAFKLTPLAKVQIHKLKVFVTESIEYWTNDRHVMRRDPGRKLLLFEKAAGKPLDKQFAASEIRVLCGGELDPVQREEARRAAACRRLREAAGARGTPEPLPEPSENLLGDLDLGLESFWGSTEMEMNVQLPTCETMARDKTLRLHPDCSWKNVNVFHWIKIVMRISRADPEDPAGKRRRHFEISIDSPFTVLDCRATQANTALPRYSGPDGPGPQQRLQTSCGCPDAQPVDQNLAEVPRPLVMVEEDIIGPGGRRLRLENQSGPARLRQAAHLQTGSRISGGLNEARPETSLTPVEPERPIHLIRHPSHNPPAFDADEPPPPLPTPLLTPPPRYDMIVGTPSVDGLADYFSRLAAYESMARAGGVASDACETSGRRSSDSDTTTIRPSAETTPMSAPVSGTGSSLTSGSDSTSAGPSNPATYDREVDPFSNVRTAPLAAQGREGGGELRAGMGPADDSSSTSANDDDDDDDDDDIDDGHARPHRRGRVNVANPRTPGGRLVPSRSLEIERPVLRLDMTSVLQRRAHPDWPSSST